MKKTQNNIKVLSVSLKTGQNNFKLNELSKDKFILKTKASYIELQDCLARWVLEDPDYLFRNEGFKTSKGSVQKVLDNNVVIIDTEGKLNVNSDKNVSGVFGRQGPEIEEIPMTRRTNFECPSIFFDNNQKIETEQIQTTEKKSVKKPQTPHKTSIFIANDQRIETEPVPTTDRTTDRKSVKKVFTSDKKNFKKATSSKNIASNKDSANKRMYAPLMKSELKGKNPHLTTYEPKKDNREEKKRLAKLMTFFSTIRSHAQVPYLLLTRSTVNLVLFKHAFHTC